MRVRLSLGMLVLLLFGLAGALAGRLPTAASSPGSSAGARAGIMATVPTPATQLFLPLVQGGSATPTPTPTPAPGLPLSEFVTADFTGSGGCATCHTGLTDASGTDVSMPTDWRSTMMANAAKDPFWQAKVSAEVARHPALQATIEEKCATCHMPMARTQALVDGSPVAILGDGFLSPGNSLHQAAMDGVSCTLCHQIQDQDLGQPATFSGHYPIDTSTNPPDRPIFGPYPDPFQRAMRNMVGFTPVQGAQIEKSGLCATCHTLYTPYVDGDGNVVGQFPEQTPYLEWEASDYRDGGSQAQSCQGCHMPQADGAVVIATQPRNLPARSPFFKHFFVGGNSFMLAIFRDNVTNLGLTASSQQFDTTRSRTLEQLQERTAQLAFTTLEQTGQVLTATLQVTNQVGHKFPSGYPSRRAWLHLTVRDAQGQRIFESGKPLADGRIQGNDADLDPTTYEPHYDRITQADQVQIYEPVMQDTDGQVTYTLLRAARYVKDNRLLPAGFDKGSVGPDIQAQGQAAQDANFVGGGDQVTYALDVSGQTGPFTVQAELLYQSLAYPHAQDLFQESTSLVTRFQELYQAADKAPVTVASVTGVAQ